ncbi:hypothetical protein PEBR_42245 [Penicillium brasilianum]|uniref:Uncharacterized protein n=1 Tax=Penicillium brasilianum TaxID=104259 RepID=A0A1S9R7X8_PENBI|nr:hypothetical protein PEBR_42245 [Penicillium brasilianum]
MNTSSASLVEQLFLDFSVQGVRQNEMNGFPIVEPWATEYVNAIRDGRYGDAVWARYHIAGEVHGGIIDGTNRTVLEMIEEDALGYKANTNPADGHPDVIEIILRIENQDVDTLRAQLRAEHQADVLADL